MRLDQEQLEQAADELRHVTRRVSDTSLLRQILRDGLQRFEKDLNGLSSDNREEVLNFYLNKTRMLLFSFHLSVIGHIAKERFRRNPNPTREAMRANIERYDRESRKLAETYQLL